MCGICNSELDTQEKRLYKSLVEARERLLAMNPINWDRVKKIDKLLGKETESAKCRFGG